MTISTDMLNRLVAQGNIERQNHAFYWSMGLALKSDARFGFAKWMFNAAAEEMGHANGFFDHVIDRTTPNFFIPEFESLPAPASLLTGTPIVYFLEALDAERANTTRLTELFRFARELGDFQTEQFLLGYIEEQTKSEAELGDIITELQRINDEAGWILMDEKYGE